MKLRPLCTACALVALLSTSASVADVRKLDVTARIALARLQSGEDARTLLSEGRVAVSPMGEIDVFVRGDVTRAQLEAAGARVRTELPGLFTAYIPADRVAEVAALAGITRIEGAQIDQITNDAGAVAAGATIARGLGPNFDGVNGAGVIIGGVDTGVDPDHHDFRNPDGTSRILRIWDQTWSPSVNPPAGFAYGREFLPPYSALVGDSQGHGTHTMGSAAGDGSQTGTGSAPAFTYAGMAPKADIIVVDGSVSGSFSRTQMLDAATYIFGQATALGKPCVVNMSIGSQFGPKDGTDAFEQGIDLLSGPGKIVVMSAGNDRNQPLHAEWKNGDPAVTLSLSSTSGAAQFFALNGYYEASEQVNVTVTTPDGAIIGPITLGNMSGAFPGPLTANGNVYVENGVDLTSTGDKQVYIEVNAASGPAITGSSGIWTITFTPVVVGPANAEVDLWRFARSMAPCDFVQGVQSNEEIISALATSLNSVAAGAYVTKTNWTDCSGFLVTFGGSGMGSIASFSSQGPTRDGRIKPDVAGPGTAIASARTLDVAGACGPGADVDLPGLVHTMNQGTSMSAPHVTGAIALLYQKYGHLTPAQVQTLLHARAVVDFPVTLSGPVPNKDFGWGKLHVGDLTDPLCTVTYPNGAETWAAGGAATITWNASDAYQGVTAVDVHLTRDNGSSWETIVLGAANTGSYNWTVTGPATAMARVRVTARDAATNAGIDQSDATFTISTAVVGVEEGGAARFELARVSPTPARGAVDVEFALPRAARVVLSVIDVNGRRVATLAEGVRPAGRHLVSWDPGAPGGPGAGLFFLRYETPEGAMVRKLPVLE